MAAGQIFPENQEDTHIKPPGTQKSGQWVGLPKDRATAHKHSVH